ncbi:hypothetical protein GGI16_005862, partial [Coemansia sp. S142-1]
MTAFQQVRLDHRLVVYSFAVAATLAPTVQELVYSFSIDSVEPLSDIELHATFIQHCVDFGSSEVALAVFGAFCQAFDTTTSDIHVIVQESGLDEAAAQRVLKG